MAGDRDVPRSVARGASRRSSVIHPAAHTRASGSATGRERRSFLYSDEVRAPVIHAGPVWGPRLQTALLVSASAAVAVFAGVEIAQGGPDRLTAPVVGLAALAGAVVMFSIPPEKLFLGWLFLSPLFQNSADESAIGRPLSFALYLAPPLVLACQTLGRGRRNADASLVDALPGVYLLYVVGSAFLASGLADENPAGLAKELFQITAIGVVVYYFLVFGPGRRVPSTAIVRVLLVAAVLQAALALVEWRTGWNLWGTSYWHFADPPRSVATLVSPGVLGAFLGFGIVLALAVLAWNGPRNLRRLAIVVLVAATPGLLVTVTRGPILATAIAALGVLLLAKQARLVTISAAAAAVLALVAMWPQLTQSELYQRRVADRTNIAGREDIQDVSLRAARTKPIAGWGYGSFERAKVDSSQGFSARVRGSLDTTSHNGFLTVLVELGAIGLALLVVPWLAAFARGVRLVRRRTADTWLIVGCMGALAVFGLTAMTTDFKYFSFAQALPWLFASLIRRERSEVGGPFTS